MKYSTIVNGETFAIEINQDDEIVVDGKAYAVDFVSIGESNFYSLLIDNESFEALVEEREGQWQVLMHGDLYTVDVADERAQRLAASVGSLVPEGGDLTVSAPIPGLVVAVLVEEGQQVETGDTLVILESMKMENELKAPRAGVVERVAVKAGDSVEQRQTLMVVT